jgi:hypothetical protein
MLDNIAASLGAPGNRMVEVLWEDKEKERRAGRRWALDMVRYN